MNKHVFIFFAFVISAMCYSQNKTELCPPFNFVIVRNGEVQLYVDHGINFLDSSTGSKVGNIGYWGNCLRYYTTEHLNIFSDSIAEDLRMEFGIDISDTTYMYYNVPFKKSWLSQQVYISNFPLVLYIYDFNLPENKEIKLYHWGHLKKKFNDYNKVTYAFKYSIGNYLNFPRIPYYKTCKKFHYPFNDNEFNCAN